MSGLAETMARHNARKQEHLRPEQRTPADRSTRIDDVETADNLLTGVPIEGAEAIGCGAAIADAAMRDCRRSGQLRGAKQDVLRALLVAVWMDGLATGAHHVADAERAVS